MPTGFGAGLGPALGGGSGLGGLGSSPAGDTRSAQMEAQAKLLEAGVKISQLEKEMQSNSESGLFLQNLTRSIFMAGPDGQAAIRPEFVDPENPKQMNLGAVTTLILKTTASMKMSGEGLQKALALIREEFQIAPDIITLWAKAGQEIAKKTALDEANAAAKKYKEESKADPALKALTSAGVSSAIGAGQSVDLTKQSMEGIQTQADARAKGSTLKVELPGAPTTGLQTELQKQIADNVETLANLNNLITSYQPVYSTYLGQGKKSFFESLEKLSPDLVKPEHKDFIANFSSWVQDAQRLYLEYRKFITGVAVRPQEKPEIEIATIAPEKDSPSEIMAKMENMRNTMRRLLARQWLMVTAGTPPTEEALSRLPLNDPYLELVADQLESRYKKFTPGAGAGGGMDAVQQLLNDYGFGGSPNAQQ